MGKANRNRTAGHNWERLTASFLNTYKYLPEVGTARELSRFYDDNSVDIVTRDISQMEEFGLAIQNKNSTVSQPYPKILAGMREKIRDVLKSKLVPVLFHRQTAKSGSRFFKKDDFACLYLEDFLEFYTKFHAYKQGFELLNEYFDVLPDDEKEDIHSKLQELGL